MNFIVLLKNGKNNAKLRHPGAKRQTDTSSLKGLKLVWETSILNGNYESKRLQDVLDSVFILNISFSSLIGLFWESILGDFKSLGLFWEWLRMKQSKRLQVVLD